MVTVSRCIPSILGSMFLVACAQEVPRNNVNFLQQDAWKYCKEKLDSYSDQQRWSILSTQASIEDAYLLSASLFSTLFFYFWYHNLTVYMRDEWEIENTNVYVAVFSLLSYLGILLTNHMIASLSHLLNRKPVHQQAALEAYTQNWDQLRNSTPSQLQPLFERFSHEYALHNNINFTKNEAEQLFPLITAVVVSVQEASLIMTLIAENTLPAHGAMSSMHGSENTSQSLLVDIHHESCAPLAPKEQQKWEYVLSKLNVLKQPSSLQTWSHAIQRYAWPIIFAVGTPLAMIINRIMNSQYDNIPATVRRYVSIVLGLSGMTLFTKIFGSEDTGQNGRLRDFLEFIDNWEYHKAFTPQCLQNLFEKLHQLYVKNHQLTLHELFIDELYKVIGEIWIYASQQKKPTNERAH